MSKLNKQHTLTILAGIIVVILIILSSSSFALPTISLDQNAQINLKDYHQVSFPTLMHLIF